MSPKFKKHTIGDLNVLEIPGDSEKGVLVILHGFGADAFDLMPISSTCEGPTWIFPQGPLQIPFSTDYVGRAWFPVNIELLTRAMREGKLDEISQAFPPELQHAQNLIENFLDELDVPREKIILGGFSQGAVLAVETALHSHKKSGGLLIFSGTLINELNWRKLAPLHAKTPFFQSHGSLDHLLPIKKAQDLEKLLTDSGLKGELHHFHGGHEIPHSILKELSHFLNHHIFKTS